MSQKWYQKASVQVAIVGGLFLLIAAMIPAVIDRFGLKNENEELKERIKEKESEIQRLEILLTPFRTIALERYTGDEREALLKLAERINELEKLNIEKSKELESLKEELISVKEQTKPVFLTFRALEVKKEENEVITKLQFSPSKNQNPGSMKFLIQIPVESENKIIKVWPTIDGGAFSTGKDSFKSSEDQKAAHLAYQLMVVGYPTFEIRTTGYSDILVSGSHLEKSLLIDNRNKKIQQIDRGQRHTAAP